MTTIGLISIIFVAAVAVCLNVWLFKKRCRLLGVLLPIFFLVVSLLAISNIPYYGKYTFSETVMLDSGETVEKIHGIVTTRTEHGYISAVLQTFFVLVLVNIPTILFLVIFVYVCCKQKRYKSDEMSKK